MIVIDIVYSARSRAAATPLGLDSHFPVVKVRRELGAKSSHVLGQGAWRGARGLQCNALILMAGATVAQDCNLCRIPAQSDFGSASHFLGLECLAIGHQSRF